MSIKSWPEGEKPREKLLNSGSSALSDAELLAVILATGYKGQSALALGRQLLQKFGNLAAVTAAKEVDLNTVAGMGPAKIASLQAIKEITNRQDLCVLKSKEALTNTDKAKQFLQRKFYSCEIEVFCGIFLNAQHQVLAFEELFKGTIDGASVYPREVIKRCLANNAAAIIFAHNHPSGVAEPSQADIAITAKLKRALGAIDVRILDHLVVGTNEVVSMTERSLV
ncbi:MAG: DNA repair protein RadC [Pseudomonadales bacterium]|nr:DNA repair protein RadC [Pseudomonadales bacterium]